MSIESLVNKINLTPHKGVIVTSGAGYGIFDVLSRNGGVTGTLLEGSILHLSRASDEYCGYSPRSYTDHEFCYDMAKRAYSRALQLLNNPEQPEYLFGLSCVGALAKNVEERPDRIHKIVFCYYSVDQSFTVETQLVQGMERQAEEKVACEMLLNALAHGFGIPDKLNIEIPVKHTCKTVLQEQHKLDNNWGFKEFKPFLLESSVDETTKSQS